MGFNGVFSASGEVWRRQRPMVMAGFDPGRIKAYFPGAGEGHRAVRAPLAARGGGGRGDRPAGRPDALHGGRHRRARVRRRHQHHRVGRRTSSSSTSTRCCPRSSSAFMRRCRIGAGSRDRKIDKHLNALQSAVAQFIAQARARMEANPGVAQPADQPDRVDDRRARHRGQRRRRRRRRRQRPHHAARRRGHHRQHARLDDLPAVAAPGSAAPRARGSGRQGMPRNTRTSRRCPTSTRASTRPCASSRWRRS